MGGSSRRMFVIPRTYLLHDTAAYECYKFLTAYDAFFRPQQFYDISNNRDSFHWYTYIQYHDFNNEKSSVTFFNGMTWMAWLILILIFTLGAVRLYRRRNYEKHEQTNIRVKKLL